MFVLGDIELTSTQLAGAAAMTVLLSVSAIAERKALKRYLLVMHIEAVTQLVYACEKLQLLHFDVFVS